MLSSTRDVTGSVTTGTSSLVRFTLAPEEFNPEALAEKLTKTAPRWGSDFVPNIWYPVCNETGWAETYELLNSQPVVSTTSNVAMLFGESNFVSLLPLFVKMGITLVCMSDIEEAVHRDNKLMLDAFRMSDDIQSFKKNFNPAKPYGMRSILDQLIEQTEEGNLGKYHFLSSEQQYKECKKALENMTICHIHFNLRNSQLSQIIANLIQDAGAKISLINVSNIVLDRSLYDGDDSTSISVPTLLQHSKDATILCSDWHLNSECIQGLDPFMSVVNKKYHSNDKVRL